MSDQEYLDYEEAAKQIRDSYINKVLAFMKGESARVVSNKEYMRVYGIVMNQCDQQDNGAKLHTLYLQTLESYIRKDALAYMNSRPRVEFLEAFVKVWENYTMFAKLLDKMFDYLNRYFLKNQSMSSLGITALKKFNELFYPEIKLTLRGMLLTQISKDRNREAVNREILKKVIQCYVDMGLAGAKTMKIEQGFIWQGDKKLDTYEQEFEQSFLTYTREEFEKKANLWISTLNCPEYLQEVDKALTKEEENAAYWLQPETASKLFQRIENELITKKAEALVEKGTGCDYMFQHSRLEELALMYKIFKRDQQTLTLVIKKMIPYIEGRGEKIVKDEVLLANPLDFTKKLLELKAEMDRMLDESFKNDMKFQKGRDTSFQNFMNQQSQTPIFIARYADKELTTGLKGVSNEETEARLDAIVRLFCCLHGRDVFIKQYTKFLSIRLLNKTSISREAEESMLNKLKVECGLNTVNKMSQMFTDIQLSKDLQAEFESKRGNLIDGIAFSAEVLMSGNWPVATNIVCNVPAQMKECTNKFTMFYKNKH